MGSKAFSTRAALPIAGLLIVIAILGSVLWFVPQWQAARVNTGQDGKPITDVERFEVENKARGTLTQVITGLGGAFFFLTAYFTWRNLQVAEDKQVSERFVKAVEMLANKELQVRIGGIYTLERIARDSNDDYWTVMEVLTSFIREKPIETIEPNESHLESEVQKRYSPQQNTLAPFPKDIQAALTVIGRRESKKDNGKCLELERAHLAGADLSWTDLTGADLIRANLSEADLVGADLDEADLSLSDFSGAILYGTNLSNARLYGANLQKVECGLLLPVFRSGAMSTIFSSLIIAETKFSDAFLIDADLTGANLNSTNLTGADLNGADLRGADLRHARVKCDQVKSTKNWQEAIYDLDFAEQLGLDKDEQIRRAKEWDKQHQGGRSL